jgi:8-oxo-dGTP diphosphatase
MDPTARTVVEVLRHAFACSREAWGSTDDTRPLDDAGRSQARALAGELGADPVGAIYSSPAARCLQTVEPLAQETGAPVKTDFRLNELAVPPVTVDGNPWPAVAWLGGRALSLLDEIVVRHRGERVVMCSHGDVLAAMLATLAGRDELDLAEVGLRKGARVTLEFDGVGRSRLVSVSDPPAR